MSSPKESVSNAVTILYFLSHGLALPWVGLSFPKPTQPGFTWLSWVSAGIIFCGNKWTQTLIIYTCSEVTIRRNQYFPIYIKVAINLGSGNKQFLFLWTHIFATIGIFSALRNIDYTTTALKHVNVWTKITWPVKPDISIYSMTQINQTFSSVLISSCLASHAFKTPMSVLFLRTASGPHISITFSRSWLQYETCPCFQIYKGQILSIILKMLSLP